jgi:hypothetical protein
MIIKFYILIYSIIIMDAHDRKSSFIRLLNIIKPILKDPKMVSKWNNIIKVFGQTSAKQLDEHFNCNNLYKLDFMLEPLFRDYHLAKIPILSKYIRDKEVLRMVNEIDNTLTDQMSSILPKILIVDRLVNIPQKRIVEHIKELNEYIYDKRYHSCILLELINFYE